MIKIVNPSDRKKLSTEQQNINSHQIDKLPISDILHLINNEDQIIAQKINQALPQIEKAVNVAEEVIRSGGKIFYIGAGTSGRLGVLDSTEMPPTFSVPRKLFQGIIAGGREALVRSIEGAEDKPEDAITDLKKTGFKKSDFLLGITSSGATPYVISALEYAKNIGSKTAYLICNPEPLIPVKVDVLISIDVGAEIITGSTRMKSGTATKMVLNMISTTVMIRLGKVYGNLMVDLQVVNNKLLDRGSRIIEQLTGLNYDSSKEKLGEADGSVKTAVVMTLKKCTKNEAEEMIEDNDGLLRKIIGNK